LHLKKKKDLMASAVCAMTLSQQNIHLIQNNCVLLSSNMLANKSQAQMYGKRPIAPAPTILTSNSSNQSMNLPKKKYNYGSMQYPASQTASVARRNARERNRVKQVNNGFSNLRQHIPQTVISALTKGGRGASKKLSKVDTLKLAVEYIRSLKDMLEDNENNDAPSSSGSSYYTDKSHVLRSEPSLSPTPSYSSESSSTMSYTPNHHMQGQQMIFKQEPFDSYTEQSTSPVPSYHSEMMQQHQIYPASSTPYKQVHHYENYSPVSADDDELLDAIAWWQTQ
jgi:achaete-scute complex protein